MVEAARELGIAVADLYGGRRRDAVRAYASTAGYHATREPEELWPAEPDVGICGGIGVACFVAELAALRGRP